MPTDSLNDGLIIPNPNTSFEITDSLNDGGVMPNSNTSFEIINDDTASLYEKKKIIKGKIFVRNNLHNKINNIVDSLSSIFSKYPIEIKNEVEEGVIDFFLINNIFVIETENYVLSDAYSYNIDSNLFKNINSTPFYKKKTTLRPYLDSFINPWYDEKNQRIFLTFIQTEKNSLSSSNYKSIVPEIYSTDVNNVNYKKIYPLKEDSTIVYSLSNNTSNIPEINLNEFVGGSFKRNPVLNEYNLTYMVRNMNSLPFIVNETLYYRSQNNTFFSKNQILLKPFYYILDTNYANPNPQYIVKGVSNKSGFIGGKEDLYLNVIKTISEKINYAFVSENESLQINNTGKYVVQFDWSSYDDINLFIGCSAINVRDIGDNILLNYKTNFTYLTSTNHSRDIFTFKKDGYDIKVNVQRPTYPSNDILLFNVFSTQNVVITGTFCKENN